MDFADEVEKEIQRNLTRAAIFTKTKAQELVSTPPTYRRRAISRNGNEYYIVPPATPGAPPRKVSGAFRRSFRYLVEGHSAYVGSPMPQSARLEFEGHPYLSVVMQKYGDEIGRIATGAS